MCELCVPRRSVLVGGTAVAAGAVLGWGRPSVAPAAAPPPIVPRAEWAPDLLPTGPIPDEPDVRFLLVHHTVNGNDYGPEEVIGLLRQIYGFHTSPDKGWPDIAYNFLIDRFGTVYEGRTGSLAGPKAGDATGGSQGFAQLCCFIGDHSLAPPSEAAMGSMIGTLAFLGDRHGLDLTPGATATFVSRGSNRHPAGESVTTPTISGHRDMSSTACPGDFAYQYVADGAFASAATAVRSGAGPVPTTAAPAPTTSTTVAPTTTTSTTMTSSTLPPTTGVAAPTPTSAPGRKTGEDGGNLLVRGTMGVAAAAAAAAAGAALALRTRATRRPPPG